MNDRERSLQIAQMVCLGLFARLIVVALDQGFAIPLANDDAERFHQAAVDASYSGSSAIRLLLEGGAFVYSGLVSLLYWISGQRSPELAKAVNVVVSLFTVVTVISTVGLLGSRLPKNGKLIVVLIWALTPSIVVFGSLMLREAFVSFLVALGLWAIFKSQLSQGAAEQQWLTVSSMFTIAAATLHVASAVFLFFPGYRLATTVNRGFGRLGLLAFGACVVLASSPLWAGKLLISTGVTSLNELSTSAILDSGSRFRSGGSAYAVPLSSSTNPALRALSTIFLAPIYFLASPFPWQIRDPLDLAAGITGWASLGVLVSSAFRLWRTRWFKILVVPLLLFSVVFSLGTANAGTAFRHRTKAWPVLVVAYCVARPQQEVRSDAPASWC